MTDTEFDLDTYAGERVRRASSSDSLPYTYQCAVCMVYWSFDLEDVQQHVDGCEG